MTQKIFNAIDQINREGIDNSSWGLADCYYTDTREYFGTEERIALDKVKILYLYVEARDSFCFIKTETADEMLTIKNENSPYPTALMIWYL